MNLRCYIIDDETNSISILKRYVEQTPGLLLSGTAVNPLDALEVFSGDHIPDLTFLDVDMPQLTGLDLAALIGPVTQVVFTTAFRDYAPEAFEQNAADYLLKPINYPRFLKAIVKVQTILSNPEKLQSSVQPYFFVKSNYKGKYDRVDIPEILYIENIGNYITIHTRKEKITTYLTLTDILTKLPEAEFSRIHQSYVVNHSAVRSVEYGQVRLSDQLNLPIGKTYRLAFRQKMESDILLSKRDVRHDRP